MGVFDAGTARSNGSGERTEDAPAKVGESADPAQDQVAAETKEQFGLVHAVKVSQDGVVYVADRTHNRIQTFTTQGKFVRQVRITPESATTPVPAGFAFSPDARQRYLYVVDSGPMRIVIFERATLTQVGSVGSRGPRPGEFDIVHHMATDSKGNLYAAEIVTNRAPAAASQAPP